MVTKITGGLLARLFYVWRIAATGLGFVVFGVGGILLALSIVVLTRLPFVGTARNLLARRMISDVFRFYIGFLVLCRLLTYEVRGRERLKDKGQFIVANHPSLLDVVFLISLIRHANCVVKGALLRNPFTRGPITAASYVMNDSENFIEECAMSLARHDSLIVFPEGTRTQSDQSFKFLRGAANVALRAGHDITPIVIRCSPPTLRKGEKWVQVPSAPPHFTITVCPDIGIEPFMNSAKERSVKARELTRFLELYYAQQLVDSNGQTA